MKTIDLKDGFVAIVDDDKYEELSRYRWNLHISGRSIYAVKDGGFVLMHRLLCGYPKGLEVDHINCNGLDNRMSNLRLCTHSENGRNRRPNRNSSTGVKGVSYSGGKFRVRIQVDGKPIYLGTYDNLNDAKKKYDDSSISFHGDFARPNEQAVL